MGKLSWLAVFSLLSLSLACDQVCKTDCDAARKDFSCYEMCGCELECESDCRNLCLQVPPNRLFSMCLLECGCHDAEWLSTIDIDNVKGPNFEVIKREISSEQKVDTQTSTQSEYAKGTTVFEDQEVKRVISDVDRRDTGVTQTNKTVLQDVAKQNEVVNQETGVELDSTITDQSNTKIIFRNNTAQRQRFEDTLKSTEQSQQSRTESETLSSAEKSTTEGSREVTTSKDTEVSTDFKETTVQLLSVGPGLGKLACLGKCISNCTLGVEGCIEQCKQQCGVLDDEEEEEDEQKEIEEEETETVKATNATKATEVQSGVQGQESAAVSSSQVVGQEQQTANGTTSTSTNDTAATQKTEEKKVTPTTAPTSPEVTVSATNTSVPEAAVNQSTVSPPAVATEQAASSNQTAAQTPDSGLQLNNSQKAGSQRQVEGLNVSEVVPPSIIPSDIANGSEANTTKLASSQVLLSSTSVELVELQTTTSWTSSLCNLLAICLSLFATYTIGLRYLKYRNKKSKDRIRRIRNQTYVVNNDQLLYKKL